ncbi:MAG: stage II sporulation protein R [Ruminococcaceae bacterium]|nr:stage II sporulation protein R [Oscillospiraceae bacterium]
MKRNLKILFVSLGLALLFSFIFSILSFGKTCEGIRNSVLRMHIVANSDSDSDQQLKLKVRDALLEKGKNIFEGAASSCEAEKKLLDGRDELYQIARDVITENGYNYEIKINIGKCLFPTRTYDNSITLPAGVYDAVNVVIGEGKGHNWWCVMFPPMCLPVSESETDIEDVLSSDQINLIQSDPKYEPRFKIVEVYEFLINKIK